MFFFIFYYVTFIRENVCEIVSSIVTTYDKSADLLYAGEINLIETRRFGNVS